MKNRKLLWIVIPLVVLLGCAVIFGVGFTIFNKLQKSSLVWGPEYATQGMEFTLLESDRYLDQNKTFFTYKLTTVGLPKDRIYTLWLLPLGSDTPVSKGEFQVNDAGTLISVETQEPFESVNLSDFAKGQALKVALMTADKSIMVFAKVIPIPIEATDNRCHLSVELLSFDGNNFEIAGEGFGSKETLAIINAIGKYEETANDDGTYGPTVYWPAVVGEESGLASYQVIGKNCNVSVEFELGPPALQVQ